MGYLLIDDRASGGLKQEFETVSCKHCQAVVKVMRRQKSGYWCRHCSGPVCALRECRERCSPFFKKIEEKLRRQAMFKSMGLN